jgi:Uma2 family endonuclease
MNEGAIMPTTVESPTSQAEGEQRVLIRGVGWEGYQTLLKLVGDQPVRLTYRYGNAELMSPFSKHERNKSLLGRLIEILTEELEIPMMSAGSTTLDREDLDQGLEADEAFYLGDLSRVRDPDRLDLDVDPPPDLAIEVEITKSSLNRLGVYGALRVPEIWRFDGRKLSILERQDDGTYLSINTSAAFSWISIEEMTNFLVDEDTRDETQWARKLRAWIQAVVVPRAREGRNANQGCSET